MYISVYIDEERKEENSHAYVDTGDSSGALMVHGVLNVLHKWNLRRKNEIKLLKHWTGDNILYVNMLCNLSDCSVALGSFSELTRSDGRYSPWSDTRAWTDTAYATPSCTASEPPQPGREKAKVSATLTGKRWPTINRHVRDSGQTSGPVHFLAVDVKLAWGMQPVPTGFLGKL